MSCLRGSAPPKPLPKRGPVKNYTPTDDEVRDAYTYDAQEVDMDGNVIVSHNEAIDQWDRWLVKTRLAAANATQPQHVAWMEDQRDRDLADLLAEQQRADRLAKTAKEALETIREQAALIAALRGEPDRPEGAEQIESYIRELAPSHPGDNYGQLADHLASRGVCPPLTDKSHPEKEHP